MPMVIYTISLWISFSSLVFSARQPNIVLIVADDLGWNDIGYHGSPIHTPNLDQLAADGVKLENHYVQPLCSPSRSILMSGRYLTRTGLQRAVILPCQRATLPHDIVTLPSQLKNLGYRTSMIGKWHLGYPSMESLPLNRGFDTFFGFLNAKIDYYKHTRCSMSMCGFDMMNGTTPTKENIGQYATHLFSEKAIEAIENHNESKPLFLYTAYSAPHTPLQAPETYTEPYKDTIPNTERRIVAGMISVLDEGIGNITKALKQKGIWQDTLFIFMTDNGGNVFAGNNNSPLRGIKGSYFEGGVRGVAFVSGPRLEVRGVINQQLLHISDWYPTLINLAGGDLTEADLDGFDQWQTINGNQSSPRDEIFFNIHTEPIRKGYGNSISDTFDTGVQAAVRIGEYKIVTGIPMFEGWMPEPTNNDSIPFKTTRDLLREVQYNSIGQNPKNVWLFNIAEDPEERNDLTGSDPEIVERLLARLAYYNSISVPVQSYEIDPQCGPDKSGGFWVPSNWPGFNPVGSTANTFALDRVVLTICIHLLSVTNF